MDSKGQALLETALILPLFAFVVLVYFSQLAMYHKALRLQAQAERLARQNALDGHPESVPLQPKRIFRGLEVVPTGGSIYTAQLRSVTGRRSFMQLILPAYTMHFSAEFPAEPPVPESR